MQAQQNDFKATGKQKELSELHQFVKQLPHMKQKFQYLTTHIHLAELIKYTTEQSVFRERWQMERTMLEGDTCFDELDDLVAMSYPLYRFLRLLCLQSICKNGINASRYDSIRKDFVQTYGYEFVALLVNLEKAGLLRRKEAFLGIDKASAFSKVKDLLVLINAEVDTIEPDDISYVSSGYAPLTVRLLQSAVTGWKNGRDDILREIPGRFIDIMQSSPPEDLSATMQRPVHTGGTYGSLAPPSSGTMTRTSRTKPVLIVVYLGGVTYMELTALRFLSKRPNFPYHIICCTTSILNGNTFLQSLA
jgi:vacuolar protein sorting-associated protein 33A